MLGTKVTHSNSGFVGTVTDIEIHINGCVHAYVQGNYFDPLTGEVCQKMNFNILELEGKTVPKVNKEKEKQERPSPSFHTPSGY